MGVSVEQWRATIGQWSGGRRGQCVTLQNSMAQTSNHNGYWQVRFLVLVSLLVIGCVELNPGPDNESYDSSQSGGALLKFRRRPGTDGQHGHEYEIKMAAFLRALKKTEEFRLASNVDGAGAFDDLVFRYRLREPDIWRTCFIQLKHKKKGGTIPGRSLTKMSGDFSLFKYFESYCQIERGYSRGSALREFGDFTNFEFIIYTNARMKGNSVLIGGDTDQISILSSRTDKGKYITFGETSDRDVFEFFQELPQYKDAVLGLDNLIKMDKLMGKEISEKIKYFWSTFTGQGILDSLQVLQSKPSIIDSEM